MGSQVKPCGWFTEEKFGLSFFNTEYAIRIVELAPALEARGFESLWLSEHTHIPKSRKSPRPGEPNPPRLL